MSKQDQAVTAGHRIAIKHAKFPDGRFVYGPLWAETLGRSIDAAIKRAKSSAVRKERERCVGIVQQSRGTGEMGKYERAYMCDAIAQKGEGMTTDELRDWHARRKYLADIPGLSQQCRDGWDAAYFRRLDDNDMHPFPATLDAADASLPPKWRWTREWTEKAAWWAAFPKRWDGEEYPSVPDTGDKIHDLYELSMKAWEQEAA